MIGLKVNLLLLLIVISCVRCEVKLSVTGSGLQSSLVTISPPSGAWDLDLTHVVTLDAAIRKLFDWSL